MDSIDPVAERGDQAQTGEEIAGCFVVSGRDGAKVLQTAEGAFDDVAKTIKLGVEGKDALAAGLIGDDWRRAARVDPM